MAKAEVQAIRFRQWLGEWDSFEFDPAQHRERPDAHIYIFSMPAVQLRSLSGVYRREHDAEEATGLQRALDEKRAEVIRDYVRFGYPYSGLKQPNRVTASDSLKKPGWLPTAIVVNILTAQDSRRGKRVSERDLVKIRSNGTQATLVLPYDNPLEQWKPKDLEPFEVIDGQHRLWAFDESNELSGDFELPVVAFNGLDIGWQAYLFWSINVSPKRINPSHAFDLYPLLRSQDWLEVFSELRIYREARAQELTELLFRHPRSPWHNRINMLGAPIKEAPNRARVTQAGWVRGLSSTLLASGKRGGTDGLFSADIDEQGPLGWLRPQQAAFLIALWSEIKDAALDNRHTWSRALTAGDQDPSSAFFGTKTMLNQEQGVRGILSVANDVFFESACRDRSRFEWAIRDLQAGGITDLADVTLALGRIKSRRFYPLIEDFARSVIKFDWRSADAPGLDDDTQLIKRAFRGSGGYVALKEQVLKFLSKQRGESSTLAKSILQV